MLFAALPMFAKGTNAKMRVGADAARLSTILHDVQTSVNLSEGTWKVIVNEANTLANRIYGHTAGNKNARRLARDLRMHVREMRKAALAGDAAGAKSHAGEALPYAHQLEDWAAGK
jgi:hypothetical protein